MNRITSIDLGSFKGQRRDIDLGQRTLLEAKD